MATRQRFAAFADHHVKAVGVQVGKVGNAGQIGGRQDAGVVGIGRAHGQVVLQAAVEQRRVLRHVADGAAHVGRVDLAHVHAVQQHGAFGGLIQRQRQLLQRGLA
ncbi:hypothetical protein D3C72_2049390 [compost metagenome]